MSKERELLKECYFYIDNKIGVSPKELLIRIEKLLAHPEQIDQEQEQEPFAWAWTRNYEGGGYTNMLFQARHAAEEYAKDSENLKYPDLVRPLYLGVEK
jgi:hypothetical protein